MTKTPPDQKVRKLLGANVKYARVLGSWSQEQLAERAGLHRTQLGAIEREQTGISIDTVGQLAAAIGVDPHVLLMKAAEAHAIILTALEENRVKSL